MKEDRIILVTGATGRQGGVVARELLARRFRVRAMTRRPDSEQARELADLGADIVQGDFDDVDSLIRATDGIWGAFSVQNSWEAGVEREEEQGKRFAEVCKGAGVSHFVYSSVASADRHTGIPHFDNKWRIEERVRQLGFPSYTVIRPVFFMENFLSPWLRPGLEEGRLTLSIKPMTVLQMIAVSDIGRYGAWAFEHHRRLNGRAIDIAGDERAMPETARIIGTAAEREIVFDPTPVEEVGRLSEDMAAMLEWFDAVGYSVDIHALARESGVRPTSLIEWAARIDWKKHIGYPVAAAHHDR
ncbi:MAG: NmrA/HSCARG family protein [Phycisphaerales bacterium]